MEAIEAIEIYKKFGNIIAVNNISFSVKNGEFFGFLGPNGAGKTTTIRILTGLLKPDSGKAKIMGYDIYEEPIKAKIFMSLVPEEANPYPDLSAWENLMLVGHLYNLPKHIIKERASRLLKILELYEVRERKAKNLSKGMRQKLLIAMALINEPKVLFLDELTSGLDVLSARKIRNLIQELKLKGVAIFLTTHNVEEAGSLCDRVAIIKDGNIIEMGSPDELKIKSGGYTYISVIFNKLIENDIEYFIKPYEYKLQGSKLLIVCNEPADLIMKIVEYAKIKNIKITNIQTSQPSLEDVFVRIISDK